MRALWHSLFNLSGRRIWIRATSESLRLRNAYTLPLRSVHNTSDIIDLVNRPHGTKPSDFTGATTTYPNYLIDPVNSQPPITPNDAISERRLLGRARLHGIASAEQLDEEIDIGHLRHIGTRLVDTPQRRNDLDLWLFLLEVSKQRLGVPGILAIWNAVQHRGPPLILNSDNANARDLVEAFIYAVGGLLRYKPLYAPELANYLKKRRVYHGIDDFLQVFRAASESEDVNALHACNEVCIKICDERVYHETIAYLWKLKRPGQAFQWHQFRLAQRDLPQSMDILLPFVGHLACEDQPIEPFIHSLRDAGVDYARQITCVYQREVVRFQREPGDRAMFDPRLTKPETNRGVKDETIARALASSGFSFDFVLNSVRMLGALEVGPMSVRQMVLDAPDMDILELRFKRLQELEMDTGSSPFVNVIQQLRVGKNFDQLKMIAASDMHHDEFGDLGLQHRLLKGYVQDNDLAGITRSLLIIRSGSVDRTGSNDHGAREKITNLLLREAISRQDWQTVLDTVVSLHQTGHVIEQSTLGRLADACLKMSRSWAEEDDEPRSERIDEFDMTAFVVGLYQQILASGTPIAISQWRVIAIALAQHNRVDAMYCLVRWLIDYYSGGHRNQHESGRKLDRDFSALFTPIFQRSLIAWDFTSSKWRRKLYPQNPGPGIDVPLITTSNAPWLTGARLLAEVSKQPNLGVTIDYRAIQREYLNRIREMHNIPISSVTRSNMKWSAARGFTATTMVEQWLQVWEVTDNLTRDIMYGSASRITTGQTRKGRWADKSDR